MTKPNTSLCNVNGWLGRDVILANYNNWSIRITKNNVNLEGMSTFQLSKLQMYTFIKRLPSSETVEVSHAESPY